MYENSLLDNAKDIALSHDHVLLVVKGDLGSRVLAIQNNITGFDGHVNFGAVFNTAWANRQNDSPLGFFFCRVWNVEATGSLLFSILRLYDHTITKWLNFHDWLRVKLLVRK